MDRLISEWYTVVKPYRLYRCRACQQQVATLGTMRALFAHLVSKHRSELDAAICIERIKVRAAGA